MSKNKKKVAFDTASQGRYEQAIPLLKQLTKKYPKDIDIWYCLGMCFFSIKSVEAAKRCLTQAVKLNNKHPVVQRALADVLFKENAFGKAIKHYKTIVKLGVNDENVFNQLGYCYKSERQINRAIEAFIKALQVNNKSVIACSNLSIIYEQMHKLDTARKYADLAVSIDPLAIDSQLIISKLDIRNKNYDIAVERLVSLLDYDLTSYQRGSICMELGRVLDKKKQYQKAFEYVNKAKKSLKQLDHVLAYDAKAYLSMINNQRSIFTKQLVDSWVDANFDDGGKVIFLIGFPRSGTTLTEQILESHDGIVSTHELPILLEILSSMSSIINRPFDSFHDIDKLQDADVQKLRNEYRKHIRDKLNDVDLDGKIILDKMPLNAIYLGFIARIFPEAKVLLALRDPRDVCLSCYMQSFQLDGAMLQFLDIESTGRFYTTVMKLIVYFKSILNIDLLTTRYEDIVVDFESSARRILEFVGVDWSPELLNFHESAKKQMVYTPSYEAVTKPIYHGAMARWRNYEDELACISNDLEPYIKEFGYQT